MGSKQNIVSCWFKSVATELCMKARLMRMKDIASLNDAQIRLHLKHHNMTQRRCMEYVTVLRIHFFSLGIRRITLKFFTYTTSQPVHIYNSTL